MIAIAVILVSSVAGVTLPLVGTSWRFLRAESGLFVVSKAFAAGVILATGFVHVLADSQEALTDPCLPRFPWSAFPFPGFFAMVSALGTLVVDFVGTQFYERKHRVENNNARKAARDEENTVGLLSATAGDKQHEEEDGGGLHIGVPHAHDAGHHHGHSHGGASSHLRHVVVSQILELGIVSHSVIIGLSLGVSLSPCTIRPLIAALGFHQFFEGFALGGCISQAKFRSTATAVMAFFFAVTTPAGIAAGTAVASFYNPNSPRALVVEGVLDAVSAGILIYMALVDLIAADFLSRSRSCNGRVQVSSFLALFLGAITMSVLALWA
ncbi:unnamed protein product [Spirodela intermedia]|uniref:Uncharacterized protein n=2 Tax=Spirodela intermedia TaxID=51605 RepID=A0A7I8JRH9_SPIIN|nr:unnamed protein product [Spirodela intermedia]CAA6672807.1 unnamed protein product [Spirodela intermedia]CAA7410026.1 unnamed protein product [Spirodela intermedia]